MAADLDELYRRHIKPLPPADRRRLLALLAQDLAGEEGQHRPGSSSILELEGVGAAIWQSVDAQEYVRALRDEWSHRP